jgi:hypothetical protein
MCNITTAGCEDLVLEYAQNDSVVAMCKEKAADQRIKKDNTIKKNMAPHDQAKFEPTKDWKWVYWGENGYPKHGDRTLSRKERRCIQRLENQYERGAWQIVNDIKFKRSPVQYPATYYFKVIQNHY